MKFFICLLFSLLTATSGFSQSQDVMPADSDSMAQDSHSKTDTSRQAHFLSLSWFYKQFLAEQLSASCEFKPSCSVFSRQAFHQFGPFKGMMLTTDRLTRCNGDAHSETPASLTDPASARLFDSVSFYNFHHPPYPSMPADTTIEPLPHRSVLLATFMSAIVPGSGKYYLGYPKQATSALLSNIFVGGAAAEMCLISGLHPVPVLGVLLFTAFYTGNIYGTSVLARKRIRDHLISRQHMRKPDHNHPPDPLPESIGDSSKPGNPATLASMHFQNQQYSICYQHLLLIPDSSIHDNDTLQNLKSKILLALMRFEDCRAFLLSTTDSSLPLFHDISALPVSFKRKSPKEAFRMGAYFPGLGQAYAGYPGRAFTSFLLQTTCAGIGILFMKEYMIISGLVYGVYPLFRLYTGGKLYGRSLAERTNFRREADLQNKFKRLIRQRWPENP